nr:hypothetical protein [Polaribacter porphyrae]
MVLSLVFVVTYLIPLLILIIFKKIKLIKSYHPETIKERKIPLLLMLVLFILLGNTLNNIANLRELSFLFFATSLALLIVYILFYFKIKSSIHLLSLGVAAGFFLILSSIYTKSFLIIIIIFFLLSGILASSRLNLKAHKVNEIYIGFFIGILSPFCIYFIL